MPGRRWFRFSLRSLFIAQLLVALSVAFGEITPELAVLLVVVAVVSVMASESLDGTRSHWRQRAVDLFALIANVAFLLALEITLLFLLGLAWECTKGIQRGYFAGALRHSQPISKIPLFD